MAWRTCRTTSPSVNARNATAYQRARLSPYYMTRDIVGASGISRAAARRCFARFLRAGVRAQRTKPLITCYAALTPNRQLRASSLFTAPRLSLPFARINRAGAHSLWRDAGAVWFGPGSLGHRWQPSYSFAASLGIAQRRAPRRAQAGARRHHSVAP